MKEDSIQGMSEVSTTWCRERKIWSSLRVNRPIASKLSTTTFAQHISSTCSERWKGRPKFWWQIQCTSKETVLLVLWRGQRPHHENMQSYYQQAEETCFVGHSTLPVKRSVQYIFILFTQYPTVCPASVIGAKVKFTFNIKRLK
jgi:hypothetical protein